MRRLFLLPALISFGFFPEIRASAQPGAPAATAVSFPRSAADAPVVAVLRIDRARRVDEPAGDEVRRYYVEAIITKLIRAPAALPPRVRLLVDLPRDSSGRWPDLKGQSVLVAARVQGNDGLQLIDRTAVKPADATSVTEAERFVAEALAADAATPVTGITQVATVAGTLPGERETQIFLATASGRPASLSIVRRPNQAPRWSASFTDVAAVEAAPPAPDSLAAFRLRCSLPAELPAVALQTLALDDQAAATEDYRLVRAQLGSCR